MFDITEKYKNSSKSGVLKERNIVYLEMSSPSSPLQSMPFRYSGQSDLLALNTFIVF
jgi:hypothetical protein